MANNRLLRGTKLDKRPLIVNMVATILGFIISMGINFILSPYIVKAVGVEAYGFIGLANNFINYASILTIALNSMAGRFITISLHKKEIEKANKYFNSVFMANIIIGILLSIISIVCVLNIDMLLDVPVEILLDVKILFIFLFFNFILGVIGATFGVATFATNKLYLTSIKTIEGNILKVILLIGLFVLFKPAVFYLGIASFIVTVYVTIFNIYYTNKLIPAIKINKKYYDFQAMIEVGVAGIWNVFNKLSSILSTGLDLLMANLFIDAMAMGTLSLSKTIPSMILSVFAMLAGVFAPQFTQEYAKGDIEKLKNSLMLSIKVLGILATIPMVIVFVYSDIFYKLWVPTENYKMLYVLTIIGAVDMAFVLPIESLWNIFTITNKIKKSSLYLFFNSVATITLVFIGLMLASSQNSKLIIIAGVSMIFSIIRSWTFLPIYGAKCLGLKWTIFYPVMIKNVISIIVVTTVMFTIKSKFTINTWIELIVVSIITGVLGILVSSMIMLDRSDKTTILNKIKCKF